MRELPAEHLDVGQQVAGLDLVEIVPNAEPPVTTFIEEGEVSADCARRLSRSMAWSTLQPGHLVTPVPNVPDRSDAGLMGA